MSTSPQLLRLMQLASPALPVGAFAYSQGLEWAIEQGLNNESEIAGWIFGIMETTVSCLDVPVLLRLYKAWKSGRSIEVEKWSAFLYASRETKELRLEELQTAGALARLLSDLGFAEARSWIIHQRRTYCNMLALAGVRWDIDPEELCSAYLWSWVENRVSSAIKAVPLGQTAGQRILSDAACKIPELVRMGLKLEDQEIGGTAFGQMMASAFHETQKTRLFRS